MVYPFERKTEEEKKLGVATAGDIAQLAVATKAFRAADDKFKRLLRQLTIVGETAAPSSHSTSKVKSKTKSGKKKKGKMDEDEDEEQNSTSTETKKRQGKDVLEEQQNSISPASKAKSGKKRKAKDEDKEHIDEIEANQKTEPLKKRQKTARSQKNQSESAKKIKQQKPLSTEAMLSECNRITDGVLNAAFGSWVIRPHRRH
jgi:hypothetical protein